MVNVLSIDGGGIRGLIPAHVLQYVEEETGHSTAELFDLIAGTSAGGMIALGLTLPEKNPENTSDENLAPRYSAQELADLFRKRGSDIFTGTHLGRTFFEEKYPHEGLMEVLEDYFGDQPVGDAVTDTMVSSYDIQSREPYFFMSWRDSDEHVPMRRAARATSEAPTYFEPAKVTVGDHQRVLVDGGVFANNPAVSAFAEADKRFPDESIRVVSLGTGTAADPYSYEEVKDWGAAKWAAPIIDVVFDGVSNAADYQLRHVIGEHYERFQTPLEEATASMDDASTRNLKRLTQDAERLLTTHQDELEALCDRLTPGFRLNGHP